MNKYKLLFTILFCLIAATSWAEEKAISDEAKAICNQVMLNIYEGIREAKGEHPELDQFGKDALFENQYGIYAIVYKYNESEEQVKKYPFEFGITLVPSDDPIFQDKTGLVFNLQFPFLDLKFAGYEKRSLFRYKSNVGGIISREGELLAQYQQQFMPLRMTLIANKSEYRVGERISFEVELENASKRHMWVKSLNSQTLYCIFHDKAWGTKHTRAPRASKFILRAGQVASMSFLGDMIEEPKEINIYCTYNMSVQGVSPSGILKVKVVEE